jgi:hypothetical protein
VPWCLGGSNLKNLGALVVQQNKALVPWWLKLSLGDLCGLSLLVVSVVLLFVCGLSLKDPEIFAS